MSWMEVETTWVRAADRLERQRVSEFESGGGVKDGESREGGQEAEG